MNAQTISYKQIFNVPNLLTSLNLCCGILAVLCIFSPGYLMYAPWFVFAAAVFDFFDGFAARLFKVQSEFGKQLDSLADVVSFGVVPGLFILSLLMFAQTGIHQTPLLGTDMPVWFVAIALLIPVFSALRLAKFNIDAGQSDSFIGLPTPATAFLISSVLLSTINQGIFLAIASQLWLIIALSIFLAFIMISNLPMFALKFKNFTLADNKIRYTFLALSAASIVIFKTDGFAIAILLYILTSGLLTFFKSSSRAH